MIYKSFLMDKLILIVISIAFVLVDWRLFYFTFADMFLLIALVLLFLINKNSFYLSRSQFYIIIVVLLLVLSNFLLNFFFNPKFIISKAIKGMAKIVYYMPTIMVMYNYIKEKKLELEFLQILSITAVVVCITGIYISVAIYLNNVLPYKFFWEFTRTDVASYTYRGSGGSIIRTRSIFSEPSYLGFYLNVILGISYFNKFKYKINTIFSIVIVITILLTFSYSSILIMIFINFVYFLSNKIKFWKDRKYLISILVMIIVLISLWNVLEETLIKRTQEILSGVDGSALSRFYKSWSYINKENIFIGNGLGNTPPIWNIYAYVLSDLGLVSFLLFVSFNLLILITNYKVGILFTILNFQKGGYLGAGYWIFLLIIFVYMEKNIKYLNKMFYTIWENLKCKFKKC